MRARAPVGLEHRASAGRDVAGLQDARIERALLEHDHDVGRGRRRLQRAIERGHALVEATPQAEQEILQIQKDMRQRMFGRKCYRKIR